MLLIKKWLNIRRSQALSGHTPYPTMAVKAGNQVIRHSGTGTHRAVSGQHHAHAATVQPGDAHKDTTTAPYRMACNAAYRLLTSLRRLLLSLFLYLFEWPAATLSRCCNSIESFAQSVAQGFQSITQHDTISAAHAHHHAPIPTIAHHKGRGGAGKWQYTVYIVPTSTIL